MEAAAIVSAEVIELKTRSRVRTAKLSRATERLASVLEDVALLARAAEIRGVTLIVDRGTAGRQDVLPLGAHEDLALAANAAARAHLWLVRQQEAK
jgi:hypothetical protein